MKDTDKTISEEELHTNPFLSLPVEKDSELKQYLVEYVGEKLGKEEVTVHMVAEVLAVEFAEFTYAFAEENFLRGYQLGIDDAYRSLTSAPEETPAEE